MEQSPRSSSIKSVETVVRGWSGVAVAGLLIDHATQLVQEGTAIGTTRPGPLSIEHRFRQQKKQCDGQIRRFCLVL